MQWNVPGVGALVYNNCVYLSYSRSPIITSIWESLPFGNCAILALRHSLQEQPQPTKFVLHQITGLKSPVTTTDTEERKDSESQSNGLGIKALFIPFHIIQLLQIITWTMRWRDEELLEFIQYIIFIVRLAQQPVPDNSIAIYCILRQKQ